MKIEDEKKREEGKRRIKTIRGGRRGKNVRGGR